MRDNKMSSVRGSNCNWEIVFMNKVRKLQLHLEAFDWQTLAHWSRLSALVQSFLLAKYQKLPLNFLRSEELNEALNRIVARLIILLEVRWHPLNEEVAELSALQEEIAELNSLDEEVAELNSLHDEVAKLISVNEDVPKLNSFNEELILLDSQIKSLQEELDSISLQRDEIEIYKQLGKLKDQKYEIAQRKEIIANREKAIAQKKEIIANREKAIANREKAIANREKAIAQKKEIIANREKAIRDEITQHKDNISFQLSAISKHIHSLNDGTFFSTIDDVWAAEDKYFLEANDELFNRTTHVTSIFVNDVDNRYQTTAEGAFDIKHDAAFDSARSASSSSASSSRYLPKDTLEKKESKIDIFGIHNPNVPSAHLMPHAATCSSYWFAIVPKVLNLAPPKNQSVTWVVLQKCIHGYFVNRDASSTSKHTTTTPRTTPTTTPTTTKEQGKQKDFVNKKSQTGANNAKLKESTKNPKKEDLVGIKHFPTNRIHLLGQATYLDSHPHVLIIPVMSVHLAENWNGDGYYAIVLAGACKSSAEASQVYKAIGAADGGAGVGAEYLATMDDLETARSLLQDMLGSVAISMKYNYCRKSSGLKAELDAALEETSLIKHAFQKLQNMEKIMMPVPKFVKTDQANRISESKINVRKIYFSSRYSEDELSAKFHAAPDPILLLAKAASNWLKRQNCLLLPGCDSDSNPDDTEVSSEEEYASCARYSSKRFRITDIDVPCDITGTCLDFESLSGSETDFGVE